MSECTSLSTRVEGMRKQFPALANGERVAKAIAKNLKGGGIRLGDLPKICVAGQGKMFYEITEAGRVTMVEQFHAIGVAQTHGRIMYLKKGSMGGQPDCMSRDLITPVNPAACKSFNPGGLCGKKKGLEIVPLCPYAQFGSAINSDGTPGKGCRCAQKAQLLVLMPRGMLPFRVQVPPTCLQALRRIGVACIMQGLSLHHCVLHFTMKSRSLPSGFVVSDMDIQPVVNPETKLIEAFPPELITQIGLDHLAEQWELILEGTDPETGDAGDDSEAPPASSTQSDSEILANAMSAPEDEGGTGSQPEQQMAPGAAQDADFEILGGEVKQDGVPF